MNVRLLQVPLILASAVKYNLKNWLWIPQIIQCGPVRHLPANSCDNRFANTNVLVAEIKSMQALSAGLN